MKAVPSEPVLSILITPKTSADAERMDHGLTKLAAKDPFFRATTDSVSGQTVLKGTDELHLDRLIDRLIREFMVEAKIGAPSVIYRKINRKLLEPIMKIEVATPDECMRIVMGDIQSRRGKILDQDTLGTPTKIEALVPLANMFGYVNKLLSMSSGLASFSMQFDHYAAFPTGNHPDDRPPFTVAKRA